MRWCCCSWVLHSRDLVLSKALTSSLIFLLYFPEYLPAPKMFRIQYFLNSFSILGCVFIMFWWIIFLSSTSYSFFGGKSSAVKVNLDLSLRTQKEAGLCQAGAGLTAFITDLCLGMTWPCIFVCSSLLSQWPLLVHLILKPTRTTLIPGPHLPYLSWSQVWWHLFCSFAFSLLFPCRFFLYIHMPNTTLMQLSFPSVFQYNSWRSCEKCDALLPPLLPARQPCDYSSGSEWVLMALGNTRGILVQPLASLTSSCADP